jgi:cephalosporin-C deacetylase-like acetyl esterase
MEYRVDKERLLDIISAWDGFLKRRVHLVACGGTALTLLGIKASTKDIDLMVPELSEYEYLIGILKQLGYKSATGWG